MEIFWTVWLFALVPVSFAAAEGYALWKGKMTLSRCRKLGRRSHGWSEFWLGFSPPIFSGFAKVAL